MLGAEVAGIPPLAVATAAEDLDDGEEVVGELLLCGQVCGVEDEQADAALLEDVFQQLEGKAAQAVPGGHHDFSESSLVCGVQKGEQPLALPVDARADVGDELVVWVLGQQEVGLALQVVLLLGRGDAGVDDLCFLLRLRGQCMLVGRELVQSDAPC